MIRPASFADIDGLKAAIVAAYAPFVAQGVDVPDATEGLADCIRDHHVWVAEDRGFILGGIVLILRREGAYIANLAVHPIGEGQGLGRQLIDIATTTAQLAGCDRVALTTHKDMTGTQAFYARLGWTQTAQNGEKITFALDLY